MTNKLETAKIQILQESWSISSRDKQLNVVLGISAKTFRYVSRDKILRVFWQPYPGVFTPTADPVL